LEFKDIPSDWKRATRIAIDIENDLEHKDWLKLFDPTLGKYGIANTKIKYYVSSFVVKAKLN
jgi:hypothetical protein